jgi:Tfp pilus assembly protein PilF
MPRLLSLLLPLCAASLAAQSLTGPAVRHVEAAQRAQAQHDCHTAAKEFGLAAQLTPSSGELRSNQGVALYCDGQWDQAIAALHKALQLNHNLSAPHLFLGLASYHLADLHTAANELQSYLSAKPDDTVGRLWLGYTEAAEHQSAAAINDFLMITSVHPENADAQYALGESSLELGRESIRRLQALNPESPYLFQIAGEQYRTLGDQAYADKAFAVQSEKQKSLSAQQANTAAEQKGLYQQAHDAEARAQAAFDAVVSYAPDSDRAHQIRADGLMLQQQVAAALVEYQTVAKLNPSLPGIHEAIANCLMQQSQFADALLEIEAELKLQPESSEVLTEMGRIQFAMGNSVAALTSLQKAVARKNAPAVAYLLLARVSLQNSDAKTATNALLIYVSHEPQSAIAHYLLARAYRMQDERANMARELVEYRKLSQSVEDQQLIHGITDAPNHLADQPVVTAADEAETDAQPQSNH